MRTRAVILGLLLLWPVSAFAQFMGVLSTPINVATIGATTTGPTNQVLAQGSGVRIRLLGFFLSSTNRVNVTFRDSNGTLCTGTLALATAGTLSVPVQPPGYICETAANTALQLNVTDTSLAGNVVGTIGGTLIWQASQ